MFICSGSSLVSTAIIVSSLIQASSVSRMYNDQLVMQERERNGSVRERVLYCNLYCIGRILGDLNFANDSKMGFCGSIFCENVSARVLNSHSKFLLSCF